MPMPRLILVASVALLLFAPRPAAVIAQGDAAATPAPSGPFHYPREYNSLTGLPYPDEAAMARRNLIVKISNYPPVVRPQSGLNRADLVFEVESENGITRFAAIYRSQAPRHVGSVRSGRLLDLELMTMYSALLAMSGASLPIQRLIWSSGQVGQVFSPLTGDGCLDAGFCRFALAGVALEHTLFLDTQQLYRLAGARDVNYGYKAQGFAFDAAPDVGGQPVQQVGVRWQGEGNALWQYDPAMGRWLRFTDGIAHFDALDGEQLWADNLVVLQAPHARRPDLFAPGAADESLEVQLWGSGPALVMRDGRWYSGDWLRFSKATTVALQLSHSGSDKPVRLRPGRSWISIVRSLGDVTLSEYLSEPAGLATSHPARG